MSLSPDVTDMSDVGSGFIIMDGTLEIKAHEILSPLSYFINNSDLATNYDKMIIWPNQILTGSSYR